MYVFDTSNVVTDIIHIFSYMNLKLYNMHMVNIASYKELSVFLSAIANVEIL